MQRILVDFVAVGNFHDVAQVHHRYPVTYVAHHRQIMSDEEICKVESLLQVFQQIDNLGLNRYVQCGHRLVAHDKRRVNRQGASHADTLALSAAELVGEPVSHVRIQANVLQQFRHPVLVFFLAIDQPVNYQRFPDDIPGGHPRVKRAVGVLENNLHATAHGSHITGREAGQGLAIKDHLAIGGPVKLEDTTSGSCFSTAAFTNQPQGFTSADKEAHIVNRLDVGDSPLEYNSRSNREVHLEVLNF